VVRVHLSITGRVQGVSFRYATQQRARRLGLQGWVRNVPDGSVESLCDGEPEAVEALVAYVRRGPPLAEVSDVAVRDVEPTEPLHGFEIR